MSFHWKSGQFIWHCIASHKCTHLFYFKSNNFELWFQSWFSLFLFPKILTQTLRSGCGKSFPFLLYEQLLVESVHKCRPALLGVSSYSRLSGWQGRLFCLQMCNFFLAVHLSMYGAKPLWKEYLISLITLSYWVIVLHICYNKYWSIASQTSVFIIWFDWGGLQFVPQNPWQSDLGSHSSDRSAAPVRRCGAGRLW